MRKPDCGILQTNSFFLPWSLKFLSENFNYLWVHFSNHPQTQHFNKKSPLGAQNSSTYLQQKLQQRRERVAAAEKAKNSSRQSERECSLQMSRSTIEHHPVAFSLHGFPSVAFSPHCYQARRRGILLGCLLNIGMLLMICIKQQRRMQALEAQSCNGVHMFGSHFVDLRRLAPPATSPFSPQPLVACTQKSWWNAVGMQKPFFNSACSRRTFPHSRDSQKAAGPRQQIIFPARPWRSFLGNCVAQGNWQFEDFCGRRARTLESS